jgi:hypothetical protein
MQHKAITFSPCAIRGNIIHKSFIFHGIESSWHNKIYETEAAIVRQKPLLLIVDTVDNFTKAVLFIKTLVQNQPNLRIIKLIESSKINDLERHGINNNDCYQEPLEPEVLIDHVIHMFETINKIDVETVAPPEQPKIEQPKTDNSFPQSLPPFFHEVERSSFQRFIARFKDLIDDIWN